MALVTSRAIMLRNHRLGETSSVVVCYTRDHGKVRLVAKGVRKGGSRFGAALEPLTVSGVVFYLREGRDLSLLSQASIERDFPELRRDVVRMAMAGAVVELLERTLPDHEPDTRLYALSERAIEVMATAPAEALDPVLWRFMLELAARLGYRPELARCVICGSDPDSAAQRRTGKESREDRSGDPRGDARCDGTAPGRPWAGFSPELGGLVCPRCARREEAPPLLPEGHDAGLLADLAFRGVDAVAGRRITPAVRDDITCALGQFLERHAGRSMRLRSLDFLAQVRRLEDSGRAT